MRNEYNNRLQFYPAHSRGRLTLFCKTGQKRAEDSQSLISRLTFTEKDRSNHRLSFLVLQQVLHRLVYLAVLKAVEVDLGDSLRAVAEGFADDCSAYSGPLYESHENAD